MRDDLMPGSGSAGSCLVVLVKGQAVHEVPLRDVTTIGRADDNDLVLTDPTVAGHHARVQREGSAYLLTSLADAESTLANGIRVTTPHTLRHGEWITIGEAELVFQEVAQQPEPIIDSPTPLPLPRPPMSPKARRRQIFALSPAGLALLLALVAGVIYLIAPALQRGGALDQTTLTAQVIEAAPTAGTSAPRSLATRDIAPLSTAELQSLLAKAEALTLRSRFEEAASIYQELVLRAPTDSRPEAGWAWALILDHQGDQGLAHARRALELDPVDVETTVVLARAYLEVGDQSRALAMAQSAVHLNAHNARAHAVLAEAYMLEGQSLKALDEANLSLTQDGSCAEGHRVRGWLHSLLENDVAQAVRELRVAAELQPALWLRQHELGLMLLKAEEYDAALSALQRAVALRPKAETYKALSEVYFRLGEYERARASLEDALSAGTSDADTYALRAVITAQQGQCKDAQIYIQQALAQAPAHPLALEAQQACGGATSSALPAPATQAPPGALQSQHNLSGWIAYPEWNPLNGQYDTYMAQTDGHGCHLVVEEMHQPALSPDGQWLALNGERQEQQNLFIVRPDGSSMRKITEHTEDELPSWSPDGQGLVFSSTRHGDKQSRVYIIEQVPFGGGQVQARPLNFGPDDVRGEYPSWTSEGSVVYRGCDPTLPTAECGLFSISAEPGSHAPKQLTSHPEDTAPAAYGDRIAFVSDRDGNWEIYLVNSNGSGLKRLTDNQVSDGLPAWSPDGKALAFVSDEGGVWAVWAMNPDGTDRRRLFDIRGGLNVDWLQERISWGP